MSCFLPACTQVQGSIDRLCCAAVCWHANPPSHGVFCRLFATYISVTFALPDALLSKAPHLLVRPAEMRAYTSECVAR